MTPPAQLNGGTPAAERFRYTKEFRIIPRIEQYPAALRFAETLIGKIAILGVYSVGLEDSPLKWPLILLLALITAVPQYRRQLLTFGTLTWALGAWWRLGNHWLLVYPLSALLLGGTLFWLAIRFQDSWYGRRPVASLLAAFAGCVLGASYLPKNGSLRFVVWQFLFVLSTYLWFIGYSLLDCRAKGRDSFALQLGTYRPFWMPVFGANTPLAKGSAYLRRIEAKTGTQLACSQIKGLKLFAWSLILVLAQKVFIRFVHGFLQIPVYEVLFAQSVHRMAFPWYLGWGSLIANFVVSLLSLSIWGHQIIAICRLAGFQALRNTYRPLEARSIAEFWNRYYYYFKELLVDFFFYPTFMRYFKPWPRLRLFAATFAATCFGNAFYHFFRDLNYIDEMGFWKALLAFHVYIFYTIILAIGIGVSQLRQRKVKNQHWLSGQFLPAVSVIGFFCILNVFDYEERTYPITEHFRFIAHLLNLVN
jgi:hypothetical protein